MVAKKRRQIGILALSAIVDDPRVRRQGDAFHAAGWEVIAFGLPGSGRSVPPPWPIVGCGTENAPAPDFLDEGPVESAADEFPNDSSGDHDLNRSSSGEDINDLPADEGPNDLLTAPSAAAVPPSRLRSILKRVLPLPVRDVLRPYSSVASLRAEARGEAFQKCASVLPRGQEHIVSRWLRAVLRVESSVVSAAIHTSHRLRHVARLLRIRVRPQYADEVFWTLNGALVDLYRAASHYRPAMWLANDWTTLPVAQRLAEEQNVPFGYDTHELATSEYGHRAKWRILYQPLILALERRGIAAASVVSCVSDGIAGHLQRLYRLDERPMVVRNMPHYESYAFRPTSNSIRVLYHGIVAPGRGLEASISSVPLWAEGRSLSIRGPAQDAYRAELEALIAEEGVGDRVSLLPPVPMIDLIREGTAFDVGIFIFPSVNRHNVYVLPNKIFEYVMAGLAVCVSALPEMAAVVRGHDLGVLVEGMEPEKIAAAINSLDRAGVDQFKRNAVKAAAELNWEAESPQLIAAYVRALR